MDALALDQRHIDGAVEHTDRAHEHMRSGLSRWKEYVGPLAVALIAAAGGAMVYDKAVDQQHLPEPADGGMLDWIRGSGDTLTGHAKEFQTWIGEKWQEFTTRGETPAAENPGTGAPEAKAPVTRAPETEGPANPETAPEPSATERYNEDIPVESSPRPSDQTRPYDQGPAAEPEPPVLSPENSGEPVVPQPVPEPENPIVLQPAAPEPVVTEPEPALERGTDGRLRL